MEEIKNHKITRHGNFISKVKIDIEEIKKKALPKINNEINLNREKKIFEEIKSAFSDINIDQLNLINHFEENKKFYLSNQEFNWMSRNSEDKWIQYLLYRYNFRTLPLKKIVTDFPQYLLIEPASLCNLRCVMCFQVDTSFSSNKEMMGFMPIEMFDNIIEEAKENNCNAITLASRGEPTLHKQFDKMTRIIQESKIIDCKLNTNATVLNEKKINEILSANFSEVVFSVDAGTKETYESIRVKGKWEKVLKNIELFNKVRRNNFPSSPTVTRIAGVKVKEEQDIEQMSSFWENLVDEVSIKEASPRWDSYNNEKNKITEPCMNLWTRSYIWYDGKVNPCDFDYKSNLEVGNIKDDSIKNIWNNQKYNKLRENHLNKLRCKHNPCDRCPITD